MMLMTASFLIPVMLLSLVPHQEARFLIPITLPLVFLHAQEIQDLDTKPALMYRAHESIQDKKKFSLNSPTSSKTIPKGSKSLMNLWIMINCLLAIFFGFVHQGGVYPLTAHLKEIMRKQTKTQVVHLVTAYMYPIPQSLLVQRNSRQKYFDPVTKTKYLIARKFYAYELGSESFPDVVEVIKRIVNKAEATKIKENLNYSVYLALPSSLVHDESNFQASDLTFTRDSVFYPHMSTEALPQLILISNILSSSKVEDPHNDTGPAYFSTEPGRAAYLEHVKLKQTTDSSVTGQLLLFIKQFSLSLYVIKI